jgi:hypothetical protein
VVLNLGPDTTLTTNFTFSATGLERSGGNPIRNRTSATVWC